jgi:hypothetical protein
VSVVGEVYKPEDFVSRRRKPSDLSPGVGEITPNTLQDVIREISLLKTEVEKIKRVLIANGLIVEGDL